MSETFKAGFAHGEEARADASCAACHFIVVDFGQNYPALLPCFSRSRIDNFANRSEQIVKTPI
jgi:hypothetical protein